VYSFGTAGCNLHCEFCQNWRISQIGPDEYPLAQELTPKQIVEQAINAECEAIAYTYTEPTVFFEYMLDTAKIAKRHGLKNIIVSNGFINPEPLAELVKHIDAANIDLKSMRDSFYKEHCSAKLEPVLKTLKALTRSKVWVEITNLIIPGLNSSETQIKELIYIVKSAYRDAVPLHFSAFYPCYKLTDKSQTPPEKLARARELAIQAGIKHVYTGNVLDLKGTSTYCPACGKVVIRRFGYIIESLLKDGACSCGAKIDGVWK